MATKAMTLEDWLDDLCVRFIINLPKADLSSVARICFQIEEAQWFYEDFIRLIDPTLPSMSLRNFTLKMFDYCPLLASFPAEDHLRAFEEFMQYKTRVPVRGAILLNESMDATVLVRGFKKGATWSFPRGKINKDEDDLDCAVREVYEETGFDIREAGLIGVDATAPYFEVVMQGQQVRLYVFRGVSESTVFGTRTRKEIGAIKWYKVDELPTYRKKKGGRANGTGAAGSEKFYMVAPFMVQLRQWVVKQKKLDTQKAGDLGIHHHPPVPYEETTDDNIANEPTQSSDAPAANPELMDNATQELRRLLRLRPQSEQHAGQALMSLLQPGIVPANEVHGHMQENHIDARTVQHQHHNMHHHHRPEPSQFSTEVRPRPYVTYVNVHSGPDDEHQAVLSEQIRQSQSQQLQLVHPQPLPPQVQKAMLLRDAVPSSPQMGEHSTARPVHGFPQNGQFIQDQSAYSHRAQAARSERQLPAHSANLLNVLKGNVPQPDADQNFVPKSAGQLTNRSAENHPQQRFSMADKAFVGQYGASATTSEYNLIPISGTQANPSSSDARLLRPTDKHRAGLLEMFKKTEPLMQNQLDGEGIARRSSHTSQDAKKQRPPKFSSTASALEAAAHENGAPIQTHPEANLPFRALTILSRPKPDQAPSESTAPRASPSLKKVSPRPNQLALSKTQQLGQSYPYGSAQPNPLSLFPTPPSASSLPVPGSFQFKQESTAEQKSTLLSLFGKTKSNSEQGKGKETSTSNQLVASTAPRSRLGSVASSRGEAKPVLRGNASRRGSQTPLSPADRDFLLNFLENASSNARR